MKMAVVYWSGTGKTEQMAEAVAKGITKTGHVVDIYTASEFSKEKIDAYPGIAFGCPPMGDEQLEEDEFEPMFSSIESKLQGKKIVLFGSYGWGGGEYMETWERRVKNNGAELVTKGLTVHENPGSKELADCETLGKKLFDSLDH